MTEEKSFWRDRNTVTIGLLALALAILAGLVIGFIVSRADQVAGPTNPTVPPAGPGPSSTTSTTAAQPTPSGQMVEIVAEADTYVDADAPTEGHGVESKLLVENDPPEIKQALIRFQVAGIPDGETVSQAVLRLTVERASEAVVDVALVDGNWSDATTWTDAPAAGEVVGSIQPGTAEGAVVEVDVTSAVRGNGAVDLYLTTESDDSSEFGSVESGDSAPVLAVAWGGELISPGVGGQNPGDGGTNTPTTTTVPVDAAGGVDLEGDFAVMVGAGDIADCDNDGAAVTAEIVLDVLREEPDAVVFTTGDNAYENGSEDDFAECFHPTWGQFKESIRPAVGNHDVATEDAAGYYGYFGSAAGEPGEGYYAFEVGAWQAVVLNTVCGTAGGCEAGSDQEQWLRGVLSESASRCTVAFYHHPVFSSGEHGGDDDAEDLFTALYEAGADLVVNGHDHNYERFAPQDPDGNLDVARGIRQFVVGTGGKGLDPIPNEEPNSEVRSSEAFGVLQLKLYDSGYEWQFLAEPGSTFTDSGSHGCH